MAANLPPRRLVATGSVTWARPAMDYAPASKAEQLWMHLNSHGEHWLVRSDIAHVLPIPLAEYLQNGRTDTVQAVKETPYRSVYRLHLAEDRWYVKLYRPTRWLHCLRAFLGCDPAHHEFVTALRLENRGVPVPPALAWGRLPDGTTLIVSAALNPAETLADLLRKRAASETDAAAPFRNRLIEQTARLVARLHDLGLCHHDLHADNLLIWYSPEGAQVVLLDFREVKRRTMNTCRTRANLALLGQSMALLTHKTERRRFLEAYRHHRRTLSIARTDVFRWARAIERAMRKGCVRYWRRANKRYISPSRRVYRLQLGHWHLWAASTLPRSVAHACLQIAQNGQLFPSCRLIKSSASGTTAEVQMPGWHKPVIVKSFGRGKSFWSRLGRRYQSLARRAWLAGWQLLEAQLPTAKPLALIERRSWLGVSASFLVLEKLEDAVTLREYAEQMNEKHLLRQLGCSIARLLRLAHERGFSHPDLKASNILVQYRSAGPRIFFVDVTHVRLGCLSLARRARDLARLYVSFRGDRRLGRADWLRFLFTYLGTHKPAWKALWRRIHTLAARKVQRNLRRNRPLS